MKKRGRRRGWRKRKRKGVTDLRSRSPSYSPVRRRHPHLSKSSYTSFSPAVRSGVCSRGDPLALVESKRRGDRQHPDDTRTTPGRRRGGGGTGRGEGGGGRDGGEEGGVEGGVVCGRCCENPLPSTPLHNLPKGLLVGCCSVSSGFNSRREGTLPPPDVLRVVLPPKPPKPPRLPLPLPPPTFTPGPSCLQVRLRLRLSISSRELLGYPFGTVLRLLTSSCFFLPLCLLHFLLSLFLFLSLT